MTHIVLNGSDWSSKREHKTWGELLAAVEDELSEVGQVVTAARFDGVDTPTYRDRDHLGSPIDRSSSIEIDSASTTALLRQGLSEAAGALEALCGEATRIGSDFRGDDLEVANKELVTLAQSLGTLVTLIGVVGQAMNVRFDSLEVPGGTAQALFEETGTQVASLVVSQRDEDWVAVADTLEQDVSPTLARWRGLLTTLHERAAVENAL